MLTTKKPNVSDNEVGKNNERQNEYDRLSGTLFRFSYQYQLRSLYTVTASLQGYRSRWLDAS